MRISYITDLRLNDRSAPSVHVDALCRAFASLGHSVTLYAPIANAFMAPEGYRVAYIWTTQRLLALVYQPRLGVRLIRDIQRERPDILFVRHSHLLVVPTLVALLFRIPLVSEVNGILEQDARHINGSLLSRVLLSWNIFGMLEGFNMRHASSVVAVTEGIQRFITNTYGVSKERIEVIANGVDTDAFFLEADSGVRNSLRIPQGACVIGYVGSLHTWQGVTYLVQAARILKEQGMKNMHVLIVGSGEERESLEQLISSLDVLDVTTIVPAVPHAQVPRYISAIDICVSYPLTLRGGATSPFKVYEYLASGKAVVSSDIAGMREEFGNVVSYAHPENAESLAEVLTHLLHDTSLRSTYGGVGRAFVEEGHSWRAVAERILALAVELSRSTPTLSLRARGRVQ